MALPGIDRQSAQQTVEAMVQKAYERAVKRTHDIYTQGNGSAFLARATSDAKLHDAVDRWRADGVTDDDIRWWWDSSVFEQEMFVQQDEFNRVTLFAYLRDKGRTAEHAATEVFKRHAKFGDPSDGTGEDRPIRYELKRRIVTYIERYYGKPEALNERLQNESSFNALVRKEIRAGNL